MHADAPLHIQEETDELDDEKEQDNHLDKARKGNVVGNIQKKGVVTHGDEVGNYPILLLVHLVSLYMGEGAIEPKGDRGKHYGEKEHHGYEVKLIGPRQNAQIGGGEQREDAQHRIVDWPEEGGQQACYEDAILHFLNRATGIPICSRYFATVRLAI